MAQAQQQQDGFFSKFIKKYKPGGNSVRNPQNGTGGNNNDTMGGGMQQGGGAQNDDPFQLFDSIFAAPDPEKQKKRQAPAFALNEDTVKKATEKMDFVGGLPQELRDKLSAGYDIEAISAALNHVGRTAYSNALQHGTKLTDQYLGIRMEHERQGLPEMLRSHLAQTEATNDPSMSDNPIVRQHAKFISERLAGEFPDASPQEIAGLTKEYFTEMAKAMNPKAFQTDTGQETQSGGSRGGMDVQDWGSYLKTNNGDQSAQAPQGKPAAGGQSS